MTDQHQHRATDEQWEQCANALIERLSRLEEGYDELVARVDALEPAHHSHVTGPSADESMALAQRLVRDIGNASDTMEGSFEMNGRSYIYKAYSEPTPEPPAPQFTAKYLFTPSNILFDSFCYDPSDSNSVWFGAIITDLPAPGDNIKIAHRWGEMPSSEVHSTIGYKVVSISEDPGYDDARVWTVRATRVDARDSAPAAVNLEALAVADRAAAVSDHDKQGWGDRLFAKTETTYGSAARGWASTLVEMVAGGLPCRDADQARAAIRVVAQWLREQDPEPGALGRLLGQISTPCGVMADLLDNEANR
jgi:hypothetical protein